MSRYLLALDAGTGGCRCVIFDTEGHPIAQSHHAWDFYTPEGLEPFGKAFDPALFWNIMADQVRRALTSAASHKSGWFDAEDIAGISATSFGHACIFLDASGKELCGSPNIDARGLLTQDLIEDALGTRLYEITGQWPPLIFAPARLLWFREEAPEIFKKIARVLTMSDWMLFKLCGEYVSEPTSASTTAFYDLHAGTWSGEILNALDIDPGLLPSLGRPGEVAGELTAEAAGRCGLKPGIPVVIGGTDVACAMVGAGMSDIGRGGALAGTTAPVVLVTGEPVIDPARRLWTKPHIPAHRWLLESNAMFAGKAYLWVRDLFRGAEKEMALGEMDRAAAKAPPGSHNMFAFLGSEVMNVEELHRIRPGLFVFPPPVNPAVEAKAGRNEFFRAALENIAYAVRANLEQIEDAGGVSVEVFHITGGLSRSEIWTRILADVLGRPVIIPEVSEGPALGAALCAAVGVGLYPTIEDGMRPMVRQALVLAPAKKAHQEYLEYYRRWRDLYDRIVDL